jgi:hypothetical protein
VIESLTSAHRLSKPSRQRNLRNISVASTPSMSMAGRSTGRSAVVDPENTRLGATEASVLATTA